MRTRLVLGALGVAAGLYGAWMLLDDPFADLVNVVVWLAAGVVLHDFVLAPSATALGWVTRGRIPDQVRGPVVVGAVVLVSVTLVAIPVLGRFGASPGNPTLLDRDYVAGWAQVAGLVVAGVLAAVVVRTVRRRRGAGAGR